MAFFKILKPVRRSLYLILLGSVLQVSVGRAQQLPDSAIVTTPDAIPLLELKNLWLASGNPVALTSVEPVLGMLDINYTATKGSYRLYADPERARKFNIHTEGYKTVGKYHLYGSFDYQLNKLQQMKWNDVLFPSEHNPFILADSIGGDYDTEIFDIRAGIAAPFRNNQWQWGIKGAYKAGSSADQTDPRPAINAVRYSIAPGITYSWGNWQLGIDGLMEMYKEDISITSVNYDLNYHFFLFNGLGNYYPNSGDNYSRDYRGQKLGGGIQAGFTGNRLENIVQAGYYHNVEKAEDGPTEKLFKAGEFVDDHFWGSNALKIQKNDDIHIIRASAGLHIIDGIWFDQASMVDNNGNITWHVFNQSVKYTRDDFTAGLEYEFLKEKSLQRNYSLSAGVRYNYVSSFYYPEEFYMDYSNIQATIKGIKNFYLRNGWSIIAQVQAELRQNLQKDADFTGIRFSEIISKPAYDYYTGNTWGAGGSLTVARQSKNEKVRLHPFVTASFNTVNMQGASAYYVNAQRNVAGVAIGLLF